MHLTHHYRNLANLKRLSIRKKGFVLPKGGQAGFSIPKGGQTGFSIPKGGQTGFTIIELLVVFALIAILSGIGIASFVSYSRSQELNQVSNDIKLLITQAKFNSLNVVRSVRTESGTTIACGSNESLSGYSVGVVGTTRLELRQICTVAGSRLVKSIALPQNISFAGASPATSCTLITFGSLSASVSGVPCVLRVVGFGGQIKTLTIDAIGNVALQE